MAILSKTVLPVLLSGLLFALSLPPFNWEWLGWGAFVPLLLAAQGRRPLEAFGLGMLAGAGCGAAGRGARLVVWSEEPLGGEFDPASPKDETQQLARSLSTALVVGYSDDARPKPFNCAALLAPDGSVLASVHHKVHLYLAEQQTNQAGHNATVVPTSFGPVGLEICFDSCYTGTTRETVQAGARLIAMPNYDPPTPRGVLHRLHAAMLPFRAVEDGVPFVRADSNGLSQIVDAHGRIVAQSPLYRPDVLVADVPLGTGFGTFFTRWGDWLADSCLAGALAGFFGLLKRPVP